MIKKYEFDYSTGEASAVFLVNDEIFTADHARSILEFFIWDYDKEADPIDEVMKKYALKAIFFACCNNHNTYGVRDDISELEGFAPVDGTSGITLIDVSKYEFDDWALDVKTSIVKN